MSSMSDVRRSSRLRSKITDNESAAVQISLSRPVTADEATLMDSDLYPSSTSDDGDGNDDDEYTEKGKKRADVKKRANGRRGGSKSKKHKKSSSSIGISNSSQAASIASREDQEEYLELASNINVTHIFNTLSTSDTYSTNEVLRTWLDTYQEDRNTFLQEFVNFFLDCCGAVSHVESHDVRSNDSSSETISELQIAFQNQKLHEFNLLVSKQLKKKSRYPLLYDNFKDLMFNFLSVANEMQMLYIEQNDVDDNNENEQSVSYTISPLVIDLLTWLSSFSVSKIRSFRYTSSMILYLFQDFLTEHVVDLERNYMAKFTKQLLLEEKKKRPSAKVIEKLKSSISDIEADKTVSYTIIDNIVKLIFVHRFKDIDDGIRCQSMIHLANWTKNNPEYFLKVTYLKYFGWLLSDTSSQVRSQVVRLLPGLVPLSNDRPVDNSAVRQFFERFKERIMEIALKDIDIEVRTHSIMLLTEVSTLGYLEDHETLSICSLLFDMEDAKVSSNSKNSRFLVAVANFFGSVTNEKYQEFLGNLPNDNKEIDGINVLKWIEIGFIVKFLSNSLVSFLENTLQDIDPEDRIKRLFQASEFLYPYFGKHIEQMCIMLTKDLTLKNILGSSPELETELDESDLPLFPEERNSVVLYMTILSGLCFGGVNSKGKSKILIAELVIPHLHDMFKKLPVESTDIMIPMLEIFSIFEFDEWINVGMEKDIGKILEQIIKLFRDTDLSISSGSKKCHCFARIVTHTKCFNLNEFDGLWLHEATRLKIEMQKFISVNIGDDLVEQCDETILLSLFGRYINKLTLLAKEYPLELDETLLNYVLDIVIPQISKHVRSYSTETVKEVHFKLLTLAVTWNLQDWVAIINQSLEQNNQNSEGATHAVDVVARIIKTLNTALIEVRMSAQTNPDNTFHLEWSLTNALLDIIIALKVFQLKLPENETSWSTNISEVFPSLLNETLYNCILDVFIFLEGAVAHQFNIDINRDAREDLNLNLNFSSNQELYENSEKELLLYLIKIKGLIKLGLAPNVIKSRIALNKGLLGPLYAQILDDSVYFEDDKTKRDFKTSKTNRSLMNRNKTSPTSIASAPHEQEAETLEPIEEAVHETHNTSSNSVDVNPVIEDHVKESSEI